MNPKNLKAQSVKPIVLLILDGWGLSPSWGGNAISMANPPFINGLWKNYPHLILQALKPLAGMYGRVGNSEIGHSLIGSGRLLEDDLTRINKAIKNGSFFENEVLKRACAISKTRRSSLHLMGLVSDGGVHSHIDHLFALIKLAKKEGVEKLFIHAFLDGLDTKPTSGIIYMTKLLSFLEEMKLGRISTIVGRHFAMDRDSRWDKTQRCYQAITKGRGNVYSTPLHAISSSYKRGFTDEFIPPLVIGCGKRNEIIKDQLIKDGDAVIFFNFREDRARQLTRVFVDKSFRPLWCFKKPDLFFVTFTQYQANLPVNVAFPPVEVKNSLPEVLSINKLKQLHVAESEKYAHVTYFFNCGKENPYPGENRIIIPSLRVNSPDKAPEMKAREITEVIIANLKKYDFIVANFANVDMVGHSGNILATSEAVRIIDQCVEKIVNKVLEVGGAVIITADHGNAEQMIYLKKEGDPETLHTLNPVPFILVTPTNKIKESSIAYNFATKTILKDIITSNHTLADIAPTILDLLGIKKPTEMTGNSLLRYLS